MVFPNLSEIIAEEINGDYSFEHVLVDGYNTLYLKKSSEVLMYDMVNRPVKSIYEANLNNLVGDILICGLGIGFSIFPIKDLPAVKSITVIEKDATIIEMMQPYLPDVTFINADALTYIPLNTYNAIFLDIWNINDRLEKYSETIRYKQYLKPEGYINFLDFEKYYDISPGSNIIRYEISNDVDKGLENKAISAINYKTELKDGIAYTPIHVVHLEPGSLMGLLDVTDYYRDYIDSNNKGTLVLRVHEVYVMDNTTPSDPDSSKPPLSRNKTWSYVREDGTIDLLSKKTRPKKYNTRKKRHKVGVAKRENILEQLIDNVGTAGVLSGTFSDAHDAHLKLTAMLVSHAAEFSGWQQSGLDTTKSIYHSVLNDSTTSWLDALIPDNTTTQAVVPWMIGKSFRNYIIGKLKAEIK